MKKRLYGKLGLVIVCLSLVFGSINIVHAEYPEKPITWIVGFRAGGATDSMARVLAQSVSEVLGEPVIVKNAPGGGGALAAGKLMKSKADGYTLSLTVSPAFTFVPHFMAAQKKPFYKWNSLTHLVTAGEYQAAFVGPADIDDWKALMEKGRIQGQLTCASMTQIDSMIIRYISSKEGFPIRIIPYKGGAGTMTALLGGHTDFAFSGGLHIKYVKSGKMRTLAATGSDRLKSEPDVPTLKDLGYDIESGASLTISLPKNVSPKIVATLNVALAKAIKSEAYVNLMKKLHFPIVYRDQQDTAKYIRQESENMAALFEKLGKIKKRKQ